MVAHRLSLQGAILALAGVCMPLTAKAQMQTSPSLKDIQEATSRTSPRVTGSGDRERLDLSKDGKYDAARMAAYQRAVEAADRQHMTGPARDVFIKSQLQSYAITGR